MEDIDILKKFDNAKLIDIVKNHQRYGYDDELRDSAICLLEERGWSREELQQKSRFAMIGTLMTIVSLVFLFYVGSSLLNTTKKYKEQAIEIACMDR